jgi:tetratricopeptide (TPR) repeat protein
MRHTITFLGALLIGLLPFAGSAQINSTNTLAAKINEQEKTVDRDPGKGDAEAWLKLAILRQDAAQYRESEHAYKKAIALLKAGDRATLADALDQMGTMYVECGQFSKAEPLERKALGIREDTRDMLGMGLSHMHLSVLLLGEHLLSSAETEAKTAVSILAPEEEQTSARIASTPEEKMTALIDLSLARCARQACAMAIPDLRRALDIALANYAEHSIPVGFLDFLLGNALWKSGDNASAEGMMRKGTQELETQLGWGHPTYIQVLKQYSLFLSQIGHTAEAQDIAARIARLEGSPGFTQMASNNLAIGLEQLH